MSNQDRSKLSLFVLGAGAVLLGAAVLQSLLIAVPGSRSTTPNPVSAGKEAPAAGKANVAQDHAGHAQAEPTAKVTAPEPETKTTAAEPELKPATPEPETKVTVPEPAAKVTAPEPEAKAAMPEPETKAPATEPRTSEPSETGALPNGALPSGAPAADAANPTTPTPTTPPGRSARGQARRAARVSSCLNPRGRARATFSPDGATWRGAKSGIRAHAGHPSGEHRGNGAGRSKECADHRRCDGEGSGRGEA